MQKKRLLLLAVLITLLLAAGVTLAFMFNATGELTNSFIPAKVTCKTTLTGTDSLMVQNTGNINAYIRVRVISYWTDAEGNIVGKASEIPTLSIAAGWLTGSDNTYYYASPVAPGNSTPNMLSAAYTIGTDTYKDETVYQVIEFLAEAVQAAPDSAASEAWGVTISNNQITAVP